MTYSNTLGETKYNYSIRLSVSFAIYIYCLFLFKPLCVFMQFE